jgi:hypothetical protein
LNLICRFKWIIADGNYRSVQIAPQDKLEHDFIGAAGQTHPDTALDGYHAVRTRRRQSDSAKLYLGNSIALH